MVLRSQFSDEEVDLGRLPVDVGVLSFSHGVLPDQAGKVAAKLRIGRAAG